MTVFIMECRRIGYSLSDGMRPDPKWGKRTFSISSEQAGTDDILAITEAAKSPKNTPDGYKLHSVRDVQAQNTVKP